VCVHQKTNQRQVVNAVGSAFAVMRGDALEIWLEKFRLDNQRNVYPMALEIKAEESFVQNDTGNDTNIVTME
jgi:hypothetical protein